jgi:alginate O-acetyltransferase complex protein AlgI
MVLTVFSYIFCGWANPLFLVLLFVSTAIDYTAGLVMARHPAVPPAGGGVTRRPRPGTS